MMASLGPSPLRKVLVLGGGDGGVATVALKYPMVELLQVEIDERVIQMSKRFFPHFSAAFTDQRHKLVVGDAVRWVEDHAHEMQSTFDLCIIDSTDEPLESVWSISFYQRLKSMLTPHGAIVQNIGSQTDLLADFRSLHQPVFQKRYLINCLTGEGSYSCQVNGAKRNHRPSLISYDMPVRRRLPFQALPCTHISKDSGL
ncbi:Spermidine synthase (SPDSY) (Putrescine aminopropyltransferase) [Durusdinium trenchii]|uniref:Spermidine synthase (SPDSY) (Putrescine aminopropyltransferase) n=1 Tax=Durusdinium trenchii TaxID=1381693 RepID=A0ABP0M5K8_9DINO